MAIGTYRGMPLDHYGKWELIEIIEEMGRHEHEEFIEHKRQRDVLGLSPSTAPAHWPSDYIPE